MASLAALGDRIGQNARIMEEWFKANNHKAPSFGEDTDARFPALTENDDAIRKARLALLDDTLALHDLILGPDESLRKLAWGSLDCGVQGVISRLGVIHMIPLGGSATYGEIAAKTGMPEPRLKAYLRQSGTQRVLREDGDRISHTAISALLVKEKLMREWWTHCIEDMPIPNAYMADAAAEYVKADPKTRDAGNKGAFNIAFDTDLPMYEWYEKDPVRQERFFGVQAASAKDPALGLAHVINGFDWASLPSDSVVVDIGGSSGNVSIALAKAFPNISKFIVQDYKNVVDEARKVLAPELKGRIEYQTHDIFTPQPVKNADVYIMRHICHNWSTEKGAEIVAATASALAPKSRIIIADISVSPANTDNSLTERYTRNMDCAMIAMLNCQERGPNDWRELVELASKDLEIANIKKPMGSADSFIEVRKK